MDNFRVIYKILRYLEAAMDYDEIDPDRLSAESLGISENRRIALLEMLVREEYVDGIGLKRSADGAVTIFMSSPGITLKGLEYLHENSVMNKMAAAAKGVVEVCEAYNGLRMQ